jgi:hypothetical protein
MFRTIVKASLGLGVGLFLSERSCKFFSHEYPFLFRYVIFGKSNEYCQKMIQSYSHNITFAPYSDKLAMDIVNMCKKDHMLLFDIISKKEYIWWFVKHAHESIHVCAVYPSNVPYESYCHYGVHVISKTDFSSPVLCELQNSIKLANETDISFKENYNKIDNKLKTLIE